MPLTKFLSLLICLTVIAGCCSTKCKQNGEFTRESVSGDIEIDNKSTLYNVDSLESAIEKITQAMKAIHYSPNSDHLVLFVHGRGAHPQKAYNKILPYLRAEYGIKVILFHWPGSWDGGLLGFPQHNAAKAKDSLKWVFEGLEIYKKNVSGKMKSLVLFTHSMGSLVLEAYLKEFKFPTDLFDNILINASASALTGHNVWVDKITCHNIYITYNNEDRTLGAAGFINASARLGKKLNTFWTGEQTLSAKAYYINFSNTCVGGFGHEYYINTQHENQLNIVSIHQFYNDIFHGKLVDVENAKHFKHIEKKHYEILVSCE